MAKIEEILQSKVKPKGKQIRLVEAVISGEVPVGEFIVFFEHARDVDKGTCADAMKHISAMEPALLTPYMDVLFGYINHRLPRVKWGIPEAIGNMAKDCPGRAARAIPYLLKNITDDEANTTVIRWCAAYALGEIATYNPDSRAQLLPLFENVIKREQNTGVRNVYVKALKAIQTQ